MADENKPTGPDLAKGVALTDIADGGMLVGHVGGDEVLLARRGNELFAVGAHCSHYHGPLAEGLVVGEIQGETGIAGSTLSHHLEKLKNDDLVTTVREGTFIRYRANTEALEDLLGFLYAECCTRNRAIEPNRIVANCQ